ncbi:MAG: hypothetical protein JJU13_18995 [Balneolaceae bacterium]|nr:hypothetical protein [Balneolaceae bacterium]
MVEKDVVLGEYTPQYRERIYRLLDFYQEENIPKMSGLKINQNSTNSAAKNAYSLLPGEAHWL